MKKEIIKILNKYSDKVDTSKEEVITESQFESIAKELVDELHLFKRSNCKNCINYEKVIKKLV